MSNRRDSGKILNWESGLNPIDEELKISYSNQNGVSDQLKVKYSLNDINGYSQKDDEIFNIIRMN
ncbi:hypothetical protein [Lacrimispora sp. 38-1]|uniref:hypothetical protein n=1 Tax=Lacrimispora sp. 38-1 TaxID=3125778 RepID=UPI003CE71704